MKFAAMPPFLTLTMSQEDWLSTSRMSQLLETTEFWTLIMKTGLLSIHAAILTFLVFLDTHIS